MNRYKLITLIFVLVSFSLFDNYLGFRIFDILGFLLFFVYIIIDNKNLRINKNVLVVISILSICLFIPSTFFGITSYQSYAGIMFLIGLLVFVLTSSIRISEDDLKIMLRVVILFLSFGLVLQVILHILTGNVISFILFNYEELRVNFGDKLFRYTGFFIEPGSHALVMVLLNAFYITVNKRRDFITHFSIGTVIASMSFAGILASIMLYLIPFNNLKSVNLNTLKKYFYSTIFIIVLFFLLYQIDNIKITFFDRIFNILYGFDGSSNDRIVKFFTQDCQCFLINNSFGYVFFSGISSDFFAEKCSNNNFAFFIGSFGYLGGIIVWITLIYYLRRKYLILFSFIYIMFSGTLTSYLFIWFHLGLISGYINMQGNKYD